MLLLLLILSPTGAQYFLVPLVLERVLKHQELKMNIACATFRLETC